MTDYFHTHTHSHYSSLDAMGSVQQMVEKVAEMGQPGLGLTDHGVMSGSFQLYKHCRENDILPFPGLEAYITDRSLEDPEKESRYHLTLLATSTDGYKNLAHLSSLSHQRENYYYKPRLTLEQLTKLGKGKKLTGIACLTGCYFSLLCQLIVHDEMAKAQRLLKLYKTMFDCVYVELQHHNTYGNEIHDDDLTILLYELALAEDLPVIVTNDSHYCDQELSIVHGMMKGIAYSADPGDVSFPGDSYHLCDSNWIDSHFTADLTEIWDAAKPSYGDLLERHTLDMPLLNKYEFKAPESEIKDPDHHLFELCMESLFDRDIDEKENFDDYIDRLEYELDVIKQLGMSQYFLIVEDYVSFCKENAIAAMARGSAVGSLVCYLLNFSWIDPIEYGLVFDRFLTLERSRPPDIDIDVDSNRRSEVVEYLTNNYDIAHIGTFSSLGLNDEGKGSLFIQFMSSMRKHDDKFIPKYGKAKTVFELPQQESDMLQAISKQSVKKSSGVHAAGLALSGKDHYLEEWIPTMLIPSSETTVTQMEMDDVEDAGFLKLDLLGLKTLATYHLTLNSIGMTLQDGEDIPLDDPKVYRLLRKGIVDTGVFQFEGYTAAIGCKELGVNEFNDLVLVNALYRPAARESKHEKLFIKRRKSKSWPAFHPMFDDALDETFGVPVFQEQVLKILTNLGVPSARLDEYLKAIKFKHGGKDSQELYNKNYKHFVELCKQADVPDISKAWDIVEAFSKYGFNKAHATAYSMLAYRLAWLKVNYSAQFHCMLLNTAGEKDGAYVKEARRCGLIIRRPDVNRSGLGADVFGTGWCVDDTGALVAALTTIKRVGEKAANEIAANAPYTSLDDLIERTNNRIVTGGKKWQKEQTLNGVLGHLQKANALASLGVVNV